MSKLLSFKIGRLANIQTNHSQRYIKFQVKLPINADNRVLIEELSRLELTDTPVNGSLQAAQREFDFVASSQEGSTNE